MWILSLFLTFFYAQAAVPTTGYDIVQKKEISLPQGSVATVYVFISPECPCSKSHEVKLRALSEKFNSKGIAFIAIDAYTGEREGEAASHFESVRLPFPVIKDEKFSLANELGAQKTPHAFVVKNGNVVYSGGVDSSQSAAADAEPFLENALNQLISGSQPSPAKTRSLGCVISRS